MPTLFVAPTANYVQTTINGAITDVTGTITLASTTNMQAPGYVIIDRTNSAGTSTPSAREVVSYTGISGNDLTGCTRGADGSTARSHSDGAVVETMPTVGMWNSLATILNTAVTTDGYLKAINSPVSISVGKFITANVESIASIAQAHIKTRLDISGASVTGYFPLNPGFMFIGSLSGPTTLVQPPIAMPQPGSFNWVSVMTRTVASGASAIVDVNMNGTSIFDAGTRPSIPGGGTFVSTASIAIKAFTEGARLSWDMDTGAGLGLHISDLVIQLRAGG